MFKAGLFTIAKTWQQPQCPPTGEWIKKIWYIYVQWNTAAAAKSLQSCPTLCDPRRQPTRLTHPWDSPGKNTGVGCHFLLQCMKVKSESEVAQSCPIPSNPVDCSLPGSSIHGFSRQEYWSGLPLPSLNGILLSHKKEQNFTTCSNMDGLGGHDAQRNKSVRKRQILYDVIYVESKK